MARSTQGCVHAGNDPLVEELLVLKQRVRESSHLASNYARAIASVRAHPTPLRSASEAKTLRHIGNYLANQIHSILRKRNLIPAAVEHPPASNAPSDAPVVRIQADKSTDRTPRGYTPAYRKRELVRRSDVPCHRS
jgi:hypothetical protein